MTDSALNYFVASGTNAARLAFTAAPQTPAAGPSPCYLWYETDTGDVFVQNGNGSWSQVNVAGTAASTTDILTGTDTSKYATADAIAALWEQGGNVSSATTTTLGEGGYFHITGTTTITDIDFTTDKAGREAVLVFDGALTLTHNASTLILPTGANITTAAGDACTIKSEGSDVIRITNYQRKDGTALAGGSSGALTLITETTTSGTAGNVTFSSISSAYRDLEIRVRGRGDNAAQDIEIRVQFNSDTGNNYSSFREIFFNGTPDLLTVTAGASLGLGRIAAAGASNSTEVGFLKIEIGDYRGTTFFKQINANGSYRRATTDPGVFTSIAGGEYSTTTAISAAKIFPVTGNFVDGTIVSLYGRN